ncbi:hypothetical protein KSS87_004248 [Heliosperma pusillum]|nr:hypothetical protein KSS87_004248 [Heliosperma pusillum]
MASIKIRLQDKEYITQISGSYGEYTGETTIAQIYFHTNMNTGGYGPYGSLNRCNNVKTFKSPNPSLAPIIGFFGTAPRFVYSIGVFTSTDA